MAFDGSTPFTNDSVHIYRSDGRFLGLSCEDLVRHGIETTTAAIGYVDVDEGAWAWACSEMVAAAAGMPSNPPPPPRFLDISEQLRDSASLECLARDALRALDKVCDETRSEVAQLWSEAHAARLSDHVTDLRARLHRVLTLADPRVP